jgi:hypothetical protein
MPLEIRGKTAKPFVSDNHTTDFAPGKALTD